MPIFCNSSTSYSLVTPKNVKLEINLKLKCKTLTQNIRNVKKNWKVSLSSRSPSKLKWGRDTRSLWKSKRARSHSNIAILLINIKWRGKKTFHCVMIPLASSFFKHKTVEIILTRATYSKNCISILCQPNVVMFFKITDCMTT